MYPTELYGSVQKQQIPISTFIQSRKHQNIKGTVTLKGVQCGQLKVDHTEHPLVFCVFLLCDNYI